MKIISLPDRKRRADASLLRELGPIFMCVRIAQDIIGTNLNQSVHILSR